MPYKKDHKALERFANANILVLGDIILDHFIWGTVSRISPEAPVPVVNVTREDLRLGGSANVLRNIYSLGGNGTLCGIIGNDAMGDRVVENVRLLPSSADGLVRGRRPTTVKTRVVAQGQQVVRFDREHIGPPSRESMAKILTFLEETLEDYDAVIVSDYSKGVVNEECMRSLNRLRVGIQERTGRRLPLIVDPKPSNAHHFIGSTVLTPNNHEAMQMSGVKLPGEEGIFAAARQIKDEIACENVLITRGEAGMTLLDADDRLITIPAMAKEVYDVTGAGDTVAATLALGLAVGCSVEEAAVLANYAAGIVVGKVGTAVVTAAELQAQLQ